MRLILDRVQKFNDNMTGQIGKFENRIRNIISRSGCTPPVDTEDPQTPTKDGMSNVLKDQIQEPGGELSVPQNHTTAAHKLLNWESIRQLLDDKIHPDYVLRKERERGLIPIYRCDGGLDLSDHLVRRLYLSYMSNMHILHPFIYATSLAQKIEVFIQQYASPSRRVGPSCRIEHTIGNAIILMVLALGAICEHKTALPSLDPNEGLHDNQVPGPASGLNTQAFPGLAYYFYAAGILGEMQGGVELPFIQASILASFYAGQSAHPCLSHDWICQATRACSFLMRAYVYLILLILSLFPDICELIGMVMIKFPRRPVIP